MLKVVTTRKFDREAKRVVRRGKDWGKMEEVVSRLMQRLPLEYKHHDHQLSGKLKDRRDCHVEPDWVLLYQVTETELILERTGTHSDIFG